MPNERNNGSRRRPRRHKFLYRKELAAMSHLISIDEATSARLVNDMDTLGFATLEDAQTSEDLKDLRAYVERQAAKHNNQYFAYHGYSALADSTLA
ncbi:MAG: hypothetical protein P4L95_24035, partial [Rouxiella aceris]|uniref:hypothetical protein n=1 Tax=Rouxiella aceris TaxID=2703884 RepID=UPI002851ECFF